MTPTLYSFRRCPYAIRARLAIAYSQQSVQLREVILKEKPEQMLQLSPKGTVPVLLLSSGEIIDESVEIMVWALSQHDPAHWLNDNIQKMLELIDKNDFEFKPWLDKYKYAVGFPEQTETYYREQCENFLVRLEKPLREHKYLFSDSISLADMAIFPFIRQFAGVDQQWFDQSPYPHLQKWLNEHINSPLFNAVMHDYPTWLTSQEEHTFP